MKPKTPGQIVKHYREKRGLTQRELAMKLGYTTSQFISIIERDLAKIPFDVIGRLEFVLKFRAKNILDFYIHEFKDTAYDLAIEGWEKQRKEDL
jgi:transcriptional regulator with XRE-family HTH domain